MPTIKNMGIIPKLLELDKPSKITAVSTIITPKFKNLQIPNGHYPIKFNLNCNDRKRLNLVLLIINRAVVVLTNDTSLGFLE